MRTLHEILIDEIQASHPLLLDEDFDDYEIEFKIVEDEREAA